MVNMVLTRRTRVFCTYWRLSMRTTFLALSFLALTTASASAITCKPNQGTEMKVEFALDPKGNPLMPEQYERATNLRIVHEACIDGQTSVSFSAVPTAIFRSYNDALEGARLLVELSKLGLAPNASEAALTHVLTEMKKASPKQPKVASEMPTSILEVTQKK